MKRTHISLIQLLLLFLLLITPCQLRDSLAVPAAGKITIRQTEYHGWQDAIMIGNGRVEAVIVPSIGRVMQFRFTGQESGPFWENRALDGKTPDAKSNEWGNFGGDKPWPAPQADWPRITPRAWPPPVAFDSMPSAARMGKDYVELTSAVDPHFGIRAIRRITLDPARPVMTIRTTFEKVEGTPRKVAVWTITQLGDPRGVFIPIPAGTQSADRYNKQSKDLPEGLTYDNGLLSMKRSATLSTKIGSDAGTLLWVGEKNACRIDSPRVAGAEYPDQNSSAEVYTNKDPLPYVELEMLGPLSTMKPGDRIERANRYTLYARREKDAAAEARAILRDALRAK
ncbi:MAG: hypothetical protein ACKV2V_02225 [Blastocatellia bacterium]